MPVVVVVVAVAATSAPPHSVSPPPVHRVPRALFDQLSEPAALIRIERLVGLAEMADHRLLQRVEVGALTGEGLAHRGGIEGLTAHRLGSVAAKLFELLAHLAGAALEILRRGLEHLLLARRGVEVLEQPTHHPAATARGIGTTAVMPVMPEVPVVAVLEYPNQSEQTHCSNEKAEHVSLVCSDGK